MKRKDWRVSHLCVCVLSDILLRESHDRFDTTRVLLFVVNTRRERGEGCNSKNIVFVSIFTPHLIASNDQYM